MKPVGVMAAVVGCLMFLFGLVRFNSAESQLIRAFGGSDGLGMTLLVGGILFSIGGALTALFASSSASSTYSDNTSNASDTTRTGNTARVSRNKALPDTKECPFCAETVKRAAKVCRYCSKDLPEIVEPVQKIYNLSFKDDDSTQCPICDVKIKLSKKEMSESVFDCPDCNTEVQFVMG